MRLSNNKIISYVFAVAIFFGCHCRWCASQITELTSERFYELATTSGQIDLIIDVRTQDEWDAGHIANATLAADLGPTLQNSDDMQATLQDMNLWSCRNCRVIVYCRTGGRAGVALDLLVDAGFRGELYNGQGTSQWVEAGYELVKTESFEAPCMNGQMSRQAAFCGRQSTSNGGDEDEDFNEGEEGDSATTTISISSDANMTLTNTDTGETIDMSPNRTFGPTAAPALEEQDESSAGGNNFRAWMLLVTAVAALISIS